MPKLAYDATCGPCTVFRKLVGFLDPKGRIAFLDLADADRLHLLDSVDPGARYRSFHLLEGVRIQSGACALPGLFGLLPGGTIAKRVFGSLPIAPRFVSWVYGVLARLHDSGSCTPDWVFLDDGGQTPLDNAQNSIKTINSIPSP